MEYVKARGQFIPQDAVCTEQNAKLIQHCAAFQELLPPIFLLSRCPVLIERDGQLVQVSGYDRDSGILAFGEPATEVPLEDAVALLSEMLGDFHFAAPADRARALAAVIHRHWFLASYSMVVLPWTSARPMPVKVVKDTGPINLCT